jgi:hypothetical protein
MSDETINEEEEWDSDLRGMIEDARKAQAEGFEEEREQQREEVAAMSSGTTAGENLSIEEFFNNDEYFGEEPVSSEMGLK